MHTHFDQHLGIRRMILDNHPRVIVECGAGNGDCTRLLSHMQLYYPFDLYVISDKELDVDPSIHWRTGISYEELKTFSDGSIGMCLIDTDHNYWTLKQELLAAKDKMEEGGLVVMHDIDTFYHDTGMGMSYWNDVPYPEKEIMECVKLGGLGDALMRFLVDFNSEYRLYGYSRESHGCAAIERRTTKETAIIRPGPGSVFAKPVPA